jgi:hypothetical protein
MGIALSFSFLRISRSVLVLLGLGLCFWVQGAAGAVDPLAKSDRHDGYISSIDEEASDVETKDVVLVPQPAPASSVSLSDAIFDQKIKTELTDRYREKFGYTQAEQNLGLPLLFIENGVAQGRSVESDAARAERKTFAEFMFRRLAEHHMDKYFRSEPSLRKAWELKERISNVEVKVNDSFTIMTIYQFSGNYVTMNINNPYLNTRFRIEMNPASFGPSEVQEAIVTFSKGVSRTVYLESHYRYYDGMLTLVGTKSLAPSMGMSLTGSTDHLPAGPNPPQSLILGGFSYTY